MNVVKATREYEDWLTRYTPLIKADIAYKHEQMALGAFPFLRATFYRWLELCPKVCPKLCASASSAPTVLCVGDLHVENFGTWRDAEGRLAWGINDFDESCYLPYAFDLIRLATSAHIAIQSNHLRLASHEACKEILDGYTSALKAGGRPFVLAEDNAWLREIAFGVLRQPGNYWRKMDDLKNEEGPIPISAAVALEHALPESSLKYRVKHRVAGLGNLGHPRYVALTEWEGGRIAREAKALVPSSALWVRSEDGATEIYYQAIIDRSVRCRDPFVRLFGHWIVRRLAPDCSRIELSALPEEREEARLVRAMGAETANIHLASAAAVPAIIRHLHKRPEGWLHRAAEAMVKATEDDWRDWKKSYEEREARSRKQHE